MGASHPLDNIVGYKLNKALNEIDGLLKVKSDLNKKTIINKLTSFFISEEIIFMIFDDDNKKKFHFSCVLYRIINLCEEYDKYFFLDILLNLLQELKKILKSK